MADADNQEQIHKEGVDHIKDKVFGENGEGQGTAASADSTTPAVVPAQPPASNPGADDPTAGIAKDAGGVSGAAHVESPSATNTQKRKSIVGTLKGLFLGGDKKEREASEAGTATQGATTTGEVAAGATGAGGTAPNTTGTAVDLPDRTKAPTTDGAADKSTTEQVKEAVTGDKDANTGTTAAPTSDATENAQETTDNAKEEPKDTSGDDDHKPPAPAGGKPPENREAIPTAGGERLGDKHWGESKIVPDNPKAAGSEETSGGVASAEGQPTTETSENTAKNTGGATGGPSKDATQEKSTEKSGNGEKKKFMDKLKDRFGKKNQS